MWNSRPGWFLGIGLVAMMFVAMPVEAGKKPPGGGGGPATTVTSMVADFNADLGIDHLIRSDSALAGGSQVYSHGVDSVLSWFQSSGSYELDTRSSNLRRMYLDLGGPLDPEISTGVFGNAEATAGHVRGRFISMVGGIDAMTGVGSQVTGGFPFVMTGADGHLYQLRMNSSLQPGTTDGVFTCLEVDTNGACDEWSVRPASDDGIAVGRLVKTVSGKGNKSTETDYGLFAVTYHLEFTRP